MKKSRAAMYSHMHSNAEGRWIFQRPSARTQALYYNYCWPLMIGRARARSWAAASFGVSVPSSTWFTVAL